MTCICSQRMTNCHHWLLIWLVAHDKWAALKAMVWYKTRFSHSRSHFFIAMACIFFAPPNGCFFAILPLHSCNPILTSCSIFKEVFKELIWVLQAMIYAFHFATHKRILVWNLRFWSYLQSLWLPTQSTSIKTRRQPSIFKRKAGKKNNYQEKLWAWGSYEKGQSSFSGTIDFSNFQ